MTRPNAKRAVERCEYLNKLGPPPPWYRPWRLRHWLRSYRAIMALDISESAEVFRSYYTPDDISKMAKHPVFHLPLSKWHGP